MATFGTLPASNSHFSNQDGSFSPAAIFSSLAGTYCCRIDPCFSLEASGTDLSVLIGYTNAELENMFHNRFLELIPSDSRQKFQQDIAQQLALNEDVEFICPIRHKDGRLIWALNKCRRIVHTDGSEYLCGMLTNISKSKSAYDALEQKLDQLNIILAQTENIIFEWDLVSDSIFFSDTWERIFGYRPITQNFGATIAIGSHLHPDDVPLLFKHLHILESGSPYQAIDARIARADGEYIWCRFRATAICDDSGRVCKLVGIIINVDTEKRATSALKKQAERDSLTKLFNTQTAQEKAAQYLGGIHNEAKCSMLIIDLDNFKHINDQYGHMFGDTVLTQCAKEIKNLFRPHDIVARIGGDEFLVLMKDVSDRELVKERCSQLISTFRTVLQPHLQDLPLSCSIGISFAPEHGTTYYDLFIAADQALYYAKGLGKNQYAFYHEQIASLPSQQRFPSAINHQIDSNDYPDALSEQFSCS